MKEKNEKKLKSFATGLAIGGILTGSGVYASTVGANNVSYSNASSGLSATTAQEAIDALYTKANTYIDPSYIDFSDLNTNSKSNVLGSKYGICIEKNNKVTCFKPSNYNVESSHIKQVFSDGTCTSGLTNSGVECYNSNFICRVDTRGVKCYPKGNGSADCTTWLSGDNKTIVYSCN